MMKIKDYLRTSRSEEIEAVHRWSPAVSRPHVTLTNRERTFGHDEIIVSKTDLKGRITYANEVFCRVAGYSEEELLGKPHNIVRHPDMPRCVFKFLWDTIQAGQEIFAYVLNRAHNGDHYWVFAHVTPSFDDQGHIVGYHSNRRSPDRSILPTIKELYRTLLTEENKHPNPKDAIAASVPKLLKFLDEQKMSYEELIFALYGRSNRNVTQTTANQPATTTA